jgi:hypothetical protein
LNRVSKSFSFPGMIWKVTCLSIMIKASPV